MTTRTLIDENEATRVYEVADDDGKVIGTDIEVVPTPQQANEAATRAQVKAHLSDLATISGSSGTLTGAQLSNAVRVLARGQRRLIRLALDMHDGTD